MWDKLEYPPQPFGQCSICSRHDCGEVVEDGVKKQKLLHVPLEMFAGGDLLIGYQCVRGMSEDLGVAVRVVERITHVGPTDEQVLRVFKSIPVDRYVTDDDLVPDNGGIDAPVATLEDKPKTRQRRAAK